MKTPNPIKSILGLIEKYRNEISKRGLILFLVCLNLLLSHAQYIEIPARLDTCVNCHGTSVNPNFCRVCNGTGRNKAWNKDNKHLESFYCKACAGGLPYICRQCKQGFSHIVDICFKKQESFIPLWYYLGLIEDFYFIGNAEINNSFVIYNHKITKITSGTIENQNCQYTQYTTVTYNKGNCEARTEGMIGGMHGYEKVYEKVYVLDVGLYRVEGITETKYFLNPNMQRLMCKEGRAEAARHCYKAHYENDSTFIADMKYIVTPNHIVCGHEEFFFKEGLLVKRVLHGKEYVYKYLKFDSRNNWIERDEITVSGQQVIRQNRTIRYL